MGETAVEFPLLQLETKSSSGVVEFQGSIPLLVTFAMNPTRCLLCKPQKKIHEKLQFISFIFIYHHLPFFLINSNFTSFCIFWGMASPSPSTRLSRGYRLVLHQKWRCCVVPHFWVSWLEKNHQPLW